MWNALDDALYNMFDGLTQEALYYRSTTTLRGEYRGREGSRIEDESWRYIVVMPEDRLDELRAFLKRVANSFDQESMYLSVAGVVEFVEAVEDDGFLI